jgi:hypothetical protein
MKRIALALLLTAWCLPAQAQSMVTESQWCATWMPQTWDPVNGYKFCRDSGSQLQGMVKTYPRAKTIKGPYFVSKAELDWHCGLGRLGCAARSKDLKVCWIFVDETLSPDMKKTVVKHEREDHCIMGLTHPKR